MSATAPEAFFLPVEGEPGGQRYCLYHAPQGRPKGAVLYVPPMGEEMNKSRRMAALQSRALAANGFAVLQLDLRGCGDSSGDSGDASWQDWVADVVGASHWLRTHLPGAPLWLWGLRAGCLLAAQGASQLGSPVHFLLWAPVSQGRAQLQQLLRLKSAAEILGGGKGATDDLRQKLAAGQSVEIAGYELSPALATGLENATLAPPSAEFPTTPRPPCRLEWFEMSTMAEGSLSPVAHKTLARWSEAAFTSRGHVVEGPSFWQTTEIEDAPALVEATVAALAATTPTEAVPT